MRRGETLADARHARAHAILDARIELLGDARALRHGARVRVSPGHRARCSAASALARRHPGRRATADRGRRRRPARRCRRAGGVRAAAARGAGGRDARRPVHPARLLAASHDRRRRSSSIRSRRAGPSARRRRAALRARSTPRRRPARCRRRSGGRRVRRRARPGRAAGGALVTRGGVRPARGWPPSAAAGPRRARRRDGRRVLCAGRARGAGARRARAALGDHHRAQPLSEGLPREEARERLFAQRRRGLFERCSADLGGAARSVGRDRLALASHRVALTAEEERARERIERAFRGGGLKPPEASEVPWPPASGPTWRPRARAARAAEGRSCGSIRSISTWGRSNG